MSEEDRILWALFLNSLIERNPERIAEIEQYDSIDDIRKELFEKLGHYEFLRKLDVAALYKNSVRRALVDYIKDGSFISYVVGMLWTIVTVPIVGEHFVTGDRPLLINGGVASYPVHCLSIAISPSKLLVIHADSEEFDEDFVRRLAFVHSLSVISQSDEYVVSSRELVDGPCTKYSKAIAEYWKSVCTTE